MAYPKGKPRPPTAGRRAGTPNRVTGDIREMLRESLRLAGGVDYLLKQAEANPQAYMGLIGKIVPKEIEATVTGTITMVDEFAGQ